MTTPLTQYHVAKDGANLGPYTEEVIEQCLKEGRLTKTDLILCPEKQEWVAIGSATFLGFHSAASLPPLPSSALPPLPAALPSLHSMPEASKMQGATTKPNKENILMSSYYVKCLRNYANFAGRARRKEYWMFFLGNFLLMLAFSLADEFWGTGGILNGLYCLGVLLPNIAVAVRRLHDIDKSGWLLLIGIIPLIGFLVLLALQVRPGTKGVNRFGNDPLLQGS